MTRRKPESELKRRRNGDGRSYMRSVHRGKMDHVAIAERALGRPLPNGAVVHHVNGNVRDNRATNLVVCPNQEYHLLLHVRARALDAVGDAQKRKCYYCKQWDDTECIVVRPRGKGSFHYECHLAYYQRRRKEAKS